MAIFPLRPRLRACRGKFPGVSEIHRSLARAAAWTMKWARSVRPARARNTPRFPADRAALEEQLSTEHILSRENTAAGFNTRFAVDRASSPAIGGMRLRNGPEAKIRGLEHGMGFILWLKEGYADCLEGYSYADSTTGVVLEATSFEIL